MICYRARTALSEDWQLDTGIRPAQRNSGVIGVILDRRSDDFR